MSMIQEDTEKKPHILVADDEEYNRRLLKRILGKYYDVDEAIHGEEVLEKLAQHDYDALLLDIMMPTMNGIDTLKIIRESSDLATLPVILVSSINDNDSIARGLELGANDFIPKPIDTKVALGRIKTQVTLKLLMDERKIVTAALEEANKMKLQMMQIAKHDLKNPLHNLSLMIAMLDEQMGDNLAMPNFTEMANYNIDTMLRIIDNFLGRIALNAEADSVNMTVLSSATILDDIIKQFDPSATKKNIEITVEQADDTIIFADEDHIWQVISNLISNAIKYTPSGGRVVIRAFPKQATWRLEIQDTGPGIPENEQQYLFQAFSKNHISTTPTDGEISTGLGLWIASEMIQAQNGTIGMDNLDGGGACFWIETPLAREVPSTHI